MIVDVKRVNDALCASRCWSVTSWWPASVHMRLKQVEVQRRKSLSGIKWSVWQEAYQHRS